MKQQAPIHQLLAREVNRKEFLGIMGLSIISIMGLSSIIKLLTGHDTKIIKHQYEPNNDGGYGSSAYGQ